ncbi:ABC transporter ATP-binding protein, partial [Flavihumibacter sp. CACIAM 22H1]|uniref:dipeptide ABC transporter ATP-binding protein n=1 Tax=Flavihumibacter sp. CACIAM 22H1 TaxID=1812911 RepID=UPI0007A8D646
CSRSAARKKTIELFRKVRLPDPEELVKKYPHQLSGGQKQRVMIAMAISCAPALLIADEPTTALDVTVQQNILQLLANLQAQTNMGLLFITHDLGLVRDFAHRVIVLYKGEIVESGPCQEVFSNPAHPYTKALLACRPILYKKGQVLPVVDDFLTSSSIAFPEKNGLQHRSPVNSANDQQVLLQINSLKVWYPKKTALFGKPLSFTKAVDELSLDIYKGEILGIVGESGCGKTSLGRALLQLVPITGGTVLLEGKNLTALPKKEWRDLRKQLQLVFQDPYGSLNPRRTIGEAIRETLAVHQPALPISRQIEKVTELLERVHLLPEHYNRYPHAFSGGQRQRIGIARALALEPRFIVFDESVSALDVSVQAQVLNLINELKAVYGFTAVFITHDLGVVQYISDRIVVMDRGKIVEIGDTEQVINNPSSPVTRRLLDALPGKGNFAR